MSEEKSPATNGQTGGELVPVPAVPALALAFSNQSGRTVCSFDMSKPAGRELMQKCEEEPDGTLVSMIGKRLLIEHIYAKPIELESPETHELIPVLRICVVTPDRKVYTCCSEGVRQSIGRLMDGRKLPPWSPPVPVDVTLRQTSKGRNWLTLLEDFSAPAAGKGKP